MVDVVSLCSSSTLPEVGFVTWRWGNLQHLIALVRGTVPCKLVLGTRPTPTLSKVLQPENFELSGSCRLSTATCKAAYWRQTLWLWLIRSSYNLVGDKICLLLLPNMVCVPSMLCVFITQYAFCFHYPACFVFSLPSMLCVITPTCFVFSLPNILCVFITQHALRLITQRVFAFSLPNMLCIFITQHTLCFHHPTCFASSLPNMLCVFITQHTLCFHYSTYFVFSLPQHALYFYYPTCFVFSLPNILCARVLLESLEIFSFGLRVWTRRIVAEWRVSLLFTLLRDENYHSAFQTTCN